jgi:hypothetical protein
MLYRVAIGTFVAALLLGRIPLPSAAHAGTHLAGIGSGAVWQSGGDGGDGGDGGGGGGGTDGGTDGGGSGTDGGGGGGGDNGGDAT